MLELLRGMRADMAAMDKRFDGIDARLDGIDARLDAMETQLEGLRYVVVASVDSLVTDMKHHEPRIAALEGARA
ncbi:hypothetical protein [Lichenibacterium dinghuense]|uniref:hypothetical protein n=1 Tax=Lichenibacterium dinghuense TaxID=2895977 RepID=UPI001F297ED5|nr:hypothetical protein [Lichenibacterium sp. 6Y81]